jgi:hypothetical protein
MSAGSDIMSLDFLEREMKRKHILLLGAAMTAVLLGSSSGLAASLTIGGDGGLVSVDSGSGSGSSGGGISVGAGRGDSLVDVQSGGSGGSGGDLLGGHPTLGAGAGEDDQVILDLFGGGENGTADAQVDLGLGGSGSDARATLFPSGGSDEDVAVVIDLFGPSAGGGGGGNGGGDVDDTPTGSVDGGSSGGGLFAGQGRQDCFAPDAQQIAHLLQRSGGRLNLAGANTVRVVPVTLCPAARADVAAALAANGRVSTLRSDIAANAQLVAALRPSYDPTDVLATAKSGSTLTLYVF